MGVVVRVASRTVEVVGRTLVVTTAIREESHGRHTPDRGSSQASPFVLSDDGRVIGRGCGVD